MHRARALHFFRRLTPAFFVAPRRGFGAAARRFEGVRWPAEPQQTETGIKCSPSLEDPDFLSSHISPAALKSQAPFDLQSNAPPQAPERQLRAPPRLEPCQIELENGAKLWLRRGKMILANPTRKGRLIYMHFYHLRDQCKCPKCKDPHSKQRSFRTSDIPLNVSPRHIKWTGKQLEVHWNHDIPGYDGMHKSTWTWQEILQSKIPAHSPWRLRSPMKPFAWNREIMENHQHWISYEDYMEDEKKFAQAMRHLGRQGLIFVKDVPQSREMVEKLATRMGPLRNTFYGSTWDVRSVPEAKNVAYTNQYLGFHMDLLYMNEPPGYQLLHCLENSCDGGESLFADTFRAALFLKKDYPDFFDVLTKRQLAYEYNHKGLIYYNRWPVFEMDPLPHKGKSLRHVNYSPPFQANLPYTRRESDTQNFGDFDLTSRALRKFLRYLEHESSVFELKLNPGECAIFANRRIVHARRQFNTASGSRWLAGAYVDEDAVNSRLNALHHKYPKIWKQRDPWLFNEPQRIQARQMREQLEQQVTPIEQTPMLADHDTLSVDWEGSSVEDFELADEEILAAEETNPAAPEPTPAELEPSSADPESHSAEPESKPAVPSGKPHQ